MQNSKKLKVKNRGGNVRMYVPYILYMGSGPVECDALNT